MTSTTATPSGDGATLLHLLAIHSGPGRKLGAGTRRLVAASNDAFLEQVLAGVPFVG